MHRFLVLYYFFLLQTCSAGLIESERVAEYHRRRHTWFPSDDEYLTTGWQRLHERRFRQLDRLTRHDNAFNGYMMAVASGLVLPNFTEYGFAIDEAPLDLWQELKRELTDAVATNRTKHHPIPLETNEPAIETDLRPLFLWNDRIQELQQRALREIQPLVEAWSRTSVLPTSAYGLRIYRRHSRLHMHVDKRSTHILSGIFHIGHMGETPWPLVIEGFDGITYSVALQPGQVLLYESAKCLHGRPIAFDGDYYSSLFLHYRPVDWPFEQLDLDTQYRVPPGWDQSQGDTKEEPLLEVIDTFVKEPACENEWCALRESRWFEADKVTNEQWVSPSTHTEQGPNDEL